MALPKHRHSQARRDKRRSHLKLVTPSLTTCPQCATKIPPHRACPACGFYRGRQVVEIAAKKDQSAN